MKPMPSTRADIEWFVVELCRLPPLSVVHLILFALAFGIFAGVIIMNLINNHTNRGETDELFLPLARLISKLVNLVLGTNRNHCPYADQAVESSNVGGAIWPTTEADLPFEMLQPHDMSATLNAHHGLKREIVGDTRFLQELGWFQCKRQPHGTTETCYSATIKRLIEPIIESIPEFYDWKITSDRPEDAFETAMNTIDKAPQEHHRHFGSMWSVYKALADYLRDQGLSLKKQEDEELVSSFCREKNLGRERFETNCKTFGEYLDKPDLYRSRVQKFKESLRNGKPIFCDFELYSKPKKKKDASKCRLVFSLKATPRIYEHMIFGHLDNIVRHLPYSVIGVPHYKFGIELASIMNSDRYAICEDISGYETKVSFTILCMEANFLRLLTDDPEYKQEIWDMCRLYSYPLFILKRSYNGQGRCVLYQRRGQVTSGTRITLAMNTTTNIVINMCRAAISQGVAESDMYQWARDRLNEGHSDKFGGKVSGDDSVIVLGPREAQLFASEGAKFLNEIGMPRKGLDPDEDSHISQTMAEVSFCSHRFVQVRFHDRAGKEVANRWLRARHLSEIFAKSCIKTGPAKRATEELKWARSQGLQMLIEFFHFPSIRLLALAILSATPNDLDLKLATEYKLDKDRSKKEVYKLIRERYELNPDTDLDNLYLPADAYLQYDTLFGTSKFNEWKSKLDEEVRNTRKDLPAAKYVDWLPSRERKWYHSLTRLTRYFLRNQVPHRALTFSGNQVVPSDAL